MKKEKGISNEFLIKFNRETEVVGISKEYLAELQRDSYNASELFDTMNNIYDEIEYILWKLELGADIKLDKVLEDIRDDVEYILKEVSSEPEEED